MPLPTVKVSIPIPVPSGLAKEWRLVEEVIDGETQPPFAEGMWFEISSSGWGADFCDHCSGYITVPNGCNDLLYGLKITDSGTFWIDFSVGERTLVLCVEIDAETGEERPAMFPDHARFLKALRSVNAYELREGRLWLYNRYSKRAWVFQ